MKSKRLHAKLDCIYRVGRHRSCLLVLCSLYHCVEKYELRERKYETNDRISACSNFCDRCVDADRLLSPDVADANRSQNHGLESAAKQQLARPSMAEPRMAQPPLSQYVRLSELWPVSANTGRQPPVPYGAPVLLPQRPSTDPNGKNLLLNTVTEIGQTKPGRYVTGLRASVANEPSIAIYSINR
jgi:hypothetical protein